MIEIREAVQPIEVDAARTLFEAYAASLGIDLAFQDFARELQSLPGGYAAPYGALLLAWRADQAIGCVAIRPLSWPQFAELKRLYVVPEARGINLGVHLSTAAFARARQIGYATVRLDTLPSMVTAQRMYESMGFREIDAYRFNPVEGTRYMELDLIGDRPEA